MFEEEIKQLKGDYKITVNLATYPARLESLRKVINSLLHIKSIDKIRVYLNEYLYTPAFLYNPRIIVKRGGKDLKDSGKFYWADTKKNEYYFSLDDDLKIDSLYIYEHLKLLKEYNEEIFVSLHGKTLVPKPKDFKDYYKMFHCLKTVEENAFINFPGTGVMVFDNSKFTIPHNLFTYHGMTDLYIAKYCQQNSISCIVRKHKEGDIALCYNGKDTLFHKHKSMRLQHKEILDSIVTWKIFFKLTTKENGRTRK